MTLQEAKDQVAKAYGYSTWSEINFYAVDYNNFITKEPYAKDRLIEEAALLYGEQKYKDGRKDAAFEFYPQKENK